MLRNGLSRHQVEQVEIHAATLDQCSDRAKPGQHSVAGLRRHKRQEYPLNTHAHVQSVKAYQERDRRSWRRTTAQGSCCEFYEGLARFE